MNRTSLHALCVEDSPFDVELIKELLEDAGFNMTIDVVLDEVDFITLLENNNYDIIFSDYNLPKFNGMVALEIALRTKPDIPFICISGAMSEEVAVDMLKKGAVDFLMKDRIKRLPYAVKEALEKKAVEKEKEFAYKALIENEKKYRKLAEKVNVVSWDYDIINDKWDYVSPQSEKILGYAPNEWSNCSWKIDKINEEHKDNYIKSCSAGNKDELDFILEYKFKRKDGKIIWIQDIINIHSVNDIPVKLRGIMIDISERKRIEEDLIKAREKAEESNSLKDAFIQNMSHEIRTPLNGIIGFAKILKELNLDDEERIEYASLILNSGKRLLDILNNILHYSKIESSKFEIFENNLNINDLIYGIIEENDSFAQEKNNKIIFEPSLPDNDSIICSDKGKIYTILNCLIKNALLFTRNGKVELKYQISNLTLQMSISDTGIGIKEEYFSRIFDKFFQIETAFNRNHEGAGLGLTIAKGLIELLGGNIWLESKFGEGSTFYFTIPFIEDIPQLESILNER